MTFATALSPADTVPLSPRAKVLMSADATQALLVSVLATARG